MNLLDIPYCLNNYTQLGSIESEPPFPKLKVSTNTYLMGDDTVREEMRDHLYNPSNQLISRLFSILENTSVEFVKLNKQEYSKGNHAPTPLLQILLQGRPDLFQSKLENSPSLAPKKHVCSLPLQPLSSVTNIPPELPPLKNVFHTPEGKENKKIKNKKNVEDKHNKKLPKKPQNSIPEPEIPEDPLRKFHLFLKNLEEWKDNQNHPDDEANCEETTPDPEPISSILLGEMHSEVVKLRQQDLLHMAKESDVQLLIGVMDMQIQQSARVILKNPKENTLEQNEESRKYLLIMNGLESALILFNVMITKHLPKSVLVEEAIENALSLCKNQLRNYIFPFYDPSFTRPDEENQAEPTVIKARKGKKNKCLDHPSTILRKITEILDKINSLILQETLTDTIILDVTAISLPTFFVEGIHSTQLSALNVIRAIFSKYPKHRAIILDDLLNDLVKLPKNKRNLRNYNFRLIEQKKSIQMVSALIMHCIQCCSGLPSKEGADIDGKESSPNSYSVAYTCANTFLQSFLKNCSNKNKENDYRPILQNIVEDLLVTLNLPEWPCSEMLLSILSRNLAQNVVRKNEISEVLRMLSIQLLGTIASRVQQDIILTKESTLFSFPHARSLKEADLNDEEIAQCICKSTIDGASAAPMLDCDRCHRWFHFECVGIDQMNPPKIWYCDQCLILKQINRQKKKLQKDPLAPPQLQIQSNNSDEETQIDMETDKMDEKEHTKNKSKTQKQIEGSYKDPVIKQLILNYLSKRSHSDTSCNYARQFFLSGWSYEDGDDETQREYYQSQWELPMSSTDSMPVLSPDGTYQIIVHLISSRPLFKSFDTMLTSILNVLGEIQIKYRTKAIKALTTIVEADPAILGETRVQAAVRSRFWDASIAVREAAVDLVGKYILYRPEFAEQYYSMVVERILDKGLSVRKRVITILAKICEQQPRHILVPKICAALVSRVHDEEQSIRDLIMKTFKGLWFKDKKISDEAISTRVHQILEVVSVVTESGNSTWFVDLMKELVKQETPKGGEPTTSGKTKIKSSEIVSLTLSRMGDCLVTNVLQCEDENEVGSPVKKGKVSVDGKKLSPMVTCIIALKMICLACPKALLRHVETLEPYLKSQSIEGENPLILQNVISIIEQAVPLIDFPGADFIDSLCKDLSALLYSQGMPVIQSSIKCLCCISFLTNRQQAMLDVIYNSFFSYLKNFNDKSAKPNQVNTQLAIIRSLFALGHLCRQYDFDNDVAKKKNISTLKQVEYGSHVENLYKEYTGFWDNKDISIKVVALMGICLLFAPYPGLVLRSEKILEAAIEPTAHPRLKNQLLVSLEEFLNDEEERMNRANETNDDEKKIDADTGVAGSISQKLLQRILAQLFDKEINIRINAINLVGHILKRGLIHPIQCVEYLVALHADQVKAISDRANRALVSVIDKDPKLVISRLSDGITLSYKFQSQVFGMCRPIEEVLNTKGEKRQESIFGRLYSLLKSTKTTRQGFLHTLVRLYETELENGLFLKYLTLLLAGLPFSWQEEPLYIIYHINRLITFTGASVLLTLKKHYGDSDQIPEISELKHVCGILFLLRLKQFLKAFYNISGVKIQGFEPQDPKQTNLTKCLPEVDLNILIPLDDIKTENWTKDATQCKEMYILLKKEMKADEMDYSSKPCTNVRKKRTKASSVGKETTQRKKAKVTKRKIAKRKGDSDDDWTP